MSNVCAYSKKEFVVRLRNHNIEYDERCLWE